jgi:hypothetical protein
MYQQEQQFGSSRGADWWGSGSRGGVETQGPSTFGGDKERFHERGLGGRSTYDEQSRFGQRGGVEGISGGVGSKQGDLNWVTRDVTECRLNPSELMHINMGLIFEGHCYIKDHMLMLLLGGAHGTGPESVSTQSIKVLRDWHDNVTRKNLSILYDVAHKINLPLPFVEPLEQRERCMKRVFSQIGRIEPVLKDFEALLEVKLGAVNLTHFYVQCMLTATNERVKAAFKECLNNVCQNLDILKEALQNTRCVPVPIVKQFLAVDTGVTSHTSSKFEGGRGIEQPTIGKGFESSYGQQRTGEQLGRGIEQPTIGKGFESSYGQQMGQRGGDVLGQSEYQRERGPVEQHQRGSETGVGSSQVRRIPIM